MKKNIITYIVSCIVLILARVFVYGMVGKINLMFFVVLNLILPSLVVIIANAVINYSKDGTVKKCFMHAVILAILSMVINLGAVGIVGDRAIDNLIETEIVNVNSNEEPNQEIMDELDRLARQKMLEEGLISEDEIIYSEPYRVNENVDEIDDNNLAGEQLVGTWDVQIEKENTLSTITGVFLDILLAFIGGVIGLKLNDRKKEKVLLEV